MHATIFDDLFMEALRITHKMVELLATAKLQIVKVIFSILRPQLGKLLLVAKISCEAVTR
ncbi:hypothetical protein WP12_15060 [Sphingomonas sp. SRS2]|nr:hypothetical protein WP12_15060 [Sphingomonas sp. SRS2]